MRIFTIGHSTKSLEDFISLLKRYGIKLVIDVRHYPSSRHYPWFSKEALKKALEDEGISYEWIEELGGFRKEGYLAYMQTDEWKKGIEKLMQISKENTAIMCAEVLWWKCHRKFISDYLVENGWEVIHIIDDKQQIHKLHEKRDVKIKCE